MANDQTGVQAQAVIFTGLQGAGKSTFYQARLAATHVRINLDLLKTRYREKLLLEECLRAGKSFVVDNTNPTPQERQRYIAPARSAGYRIIGYFFDVPAHQCVERNQAREGKARVPVVAIYGTRKRMQPPVLAEGYDELYTVIPESEGFTVLKS